MSPAPELPDGPRPGVSVPGAGPLADSAGQPWAGRSFSPGAHQSDDGSTPPGLAAALDDFAAGRVGKEAVVDALRDSRVLIPLVTELGDEGLTEEGLRVDKSQELSIVTVEGPDGRAVLPVFSSVQTLQTWDPQARPVPVEAPRAALAAAQEDTEVIVLDPMSPTEFVVRRPAVWAMGQAKAWAPPYRDPRIRDAFSASLAAEHTVRAVEIDDGDPSARLTGPEVVVTLRLTEGLTQRELDAVVERLAERWAADEAIAEGVDSLRVRLAPAD